MLPARPNIEEGQYIASDGQLYGQVWMDQGCADAMPPQHLGGYAVSASLVGCCSGWRG